MGWKYRRLVVKQNGAKWDNPTRADLKPLVQRWEPMLAQVDGLWPHRRAGKPTFWQDRYFKPKPRSKVSAPRTGVAPKPMQRPRRPRPMGR
jgi:hypothetical protein